MGERDGRVYLPLIMDFSEQEAQVLVVWGVIHRRSKGLFAVWLAGEERAERTRGKSGRGAHCDMPNNGGK